MDEILTEAIARIGETSKRFKVSQERLLLQQQTLLELQDRMMRTQYELVESISENTNFQQQLAVDVEKLLIAIQGNEAKFFDLLRIGNSDDLSQLYELCKEAQSVDYMERNYMVTIGKEIDDLTLKVIKQQHEQFNTEMAGNKSNPENNNENE